MDSPIINAKACPNHEYTTDEFERIMEWTSITHARLNGIHGSPQSRDGKPLLPTNITCSFLLDGVGIEPQDLSLRQVLGIDYLDCFQIGL